MTAAALHIASYGNDRYVLAMNIAWNTSALMREIARARIALQIVHLKWFSLESEADETAVSEEGSSVTCTVVKTKKVVCLRVKTNKAASPRETMTITMCLWCKLYARDFSPMHGEILPTKHSET